MDFRIDVPDTSPYLQYRQTIHFGGRVGDPSPPALWSTSERRGRHLGVVAATTYRYFDSDNRRNFVGVILDEMMAFARVELGWADEDIERARATILGGVRDLAGTVDFAMEIVVAIEQAVATRGEHDFFGLGPLGAVPEAQGFLDRLPHLTPQEAAQVLHRVETLGGKHGEAFAWETAERLHWPDLERHLKLLETKD